jgi:hypothetical protein
MKREINFSGTTNENIDNAFDKFCDPTTLPSGFLNPAILLRVFSSAPILFLWLILSKFLPFPHLG